MVNCVESVPKLNLCRAYNLGIIEYEQARQLQNNLVSARIAGDIPDIALLLQHHPVLTIGASGNEQNILTSQERLASKGIPVIRTDRGGDVTYHGPGQLVGYLIFDLKTHGTGLHQYVRRLEEVIIRTLNHFSITAHRDPQYPGVWVRHAKICALGIRVSRWVTKHGFALNVNTDLKHFTGIIPCGIADRRATSMAQVLGHEIALEEVASCLCEQCAWVFHINISEKPAEELIGYYVR